MGIAYGAPRLRADRLAASGSASLPAALTLHELPGEAHEWRLVTISGRVMSVHKLGDRWRAEIRVGSKDAVVVGQPGAGISSGTLLEGQVATVTGIVRRPYPNASTVLRGDQLPADVSVAGRAAAGQAVGRPGADGPAGDPGRARRRTTALRPPPRTPTRRSRRVHRTNRAGRRPRRDLSMASRSTTGPASAASSWRSPDILALSARRRLNVIGRWSDPQRPRRRGRRPGRVVRGRPGPSLPIETDPAPASWRRRMRPAGQLAGPWGSCPETRGPQAWERCSRSAASLAVTLASSPPPSRPGSPVAWPRSRGRPHARTARPRLSVSQARSTRLDARENAGLSSAEFRASEAAT
jgi:hypothetical protein